MSDDILVWADLETFGLNPATDPVLEVGFRTTDLTGETRSEFTALCWHETWYDGMMEDMRVSVDAGPQYVFGMHNKSGLWTEAKAHGSLMSDVRIELMAWLESQGVGKDDPLCGSTVRFDREMLTMWMNGVPEMMSHRIVDISSIKELCRRLNPDLFGQLEKDAPSAKKHRVQSDISDSISEYNFYRQNFLIKAGQ